MLLALLALNVIQTGLLQLKIIPCDSAYAWHTSSILCNQRTLGHNTQYLVYLDDLSNELNNIKAGCYIGEVLLNHLMFADDICVLCPSVRWLQRILDLCQAYAESHGIIFNRNKTVCMTFKAKSARSTATPVLKLGGSIRKFC